MFSPLEGAHNPPPPSGPIEISLQYNLPLQPFPFPYNDPQIRDDIVADIKETRHYIKEEKKDIWVQEKP